MSGGISRALRVVALAYLIVGAIAAWGAVVLAPWGLLLLLVTIGTFSAAAILRLMAAGFAAIEEDES